MYVNLFIYDFCSYVKYTVIIIMYLSLRYIHIMVVFAMIFGCHGNIYLKLNNYKHLQYLNQAIKYLLLFFLIK